MPKKKTRRYAPRFTEAQKKTVISEYKAGKTLIQLAASNKCSTARVRKALLDAKVHMRARGPVSRTKPAKKQQKPKAIKKRAKPKVAKTKAAKQIKAFKKAIQTAIKHNAKAAAGY